MYAARTEMVKGQMTQLDWRRRRRRRAGSTPIANQHAGDYTLT